MQKNPPTGFIARGTYRQHLSHEKFANLFENGVMEPCDLDMVARFADHKSQRISLEKQISELEKLTDKKIGAITDEQIGRFASAIRANLRYPSDPQWRKR